MTSHPGTALVKNEEDEPTSGKLYVFAVAEHSLSLVASINVAVCGI